MTHDRAGDDVPRIAPFGPVTSQPGGLPATPMNGATRMAAPFVGQPTLVVAPVQPATPAASAVVEEIPWAQDEDDETGEVEAVFEADVSETEAALAELGRVARSEEFPLDAFIIPEHARRIPNGFEGKKLPEPAPHTPVTELAERLEKLSHRLRVENADAVIARLAGGDKLDALLAGLLAGYIAGSK
jgi:hypothetical protein